jgi:hypothetical protein
MKKNIFRATALWLGLWSANSYGQNTFPAAGNAGIGTTTPTQALTLQTGNIQIPHTVNGDHGNIFIGGRTYLAENGMRLVGGNVNGTIPAGFIDVRTTNTNDGLRFRVDGNTGSTERMRITAGGNVIIGAVSSMTTPAGYKLFVETGILTEKVKVALKSSADWSDYVFEPGYRLQPLSAVESFIRANKHLPGIPAAATLVKEGGIDVNRMFAAQMEKIEELTLYVIELNKRLATLEAENKALKIKTSNIKK